MKCEFCNYDEWETIPYIRQDNPLSFKEILSCKNCRFGKVLTQLSQEKLDEFYSCGEYWHQIEDTPEVLRHAELQAKFRFKKIFPYLKNKNGVQKCLDVGAGLGYMGKILREERSSRFDYFFSEADPNVHGAILKNNPKAKVFQDIDENFDFIFLNHVLEHVIDPIGFLNYFKSKLSHGGMIYIEVPNLDYNYKNDVFPHTLFFHKKSLSLLAQKIEMTELDLALFGCIPKSNVLSKVFHKLFLYSSRFNLQWPSEMTGENIFGYSKFSNKGIWNFLLLKKD